MDEDNEIKNESNSGDKVPSERDGARNGANGTSSVNGAASGDNVNIAGAYDNINFGQGPNNNGNYNENYQGGSQGYQQQGNQGYQQESQGYQQSGSQEYQQGNQSYDQGGYQGYSQEAPQEKKVRIPVWVFVFLIAVVALDVICMLRFPGVIHDYKVYKTAEGRIHNSETSRAINDLYALAEKHPDSAPIQVKAVELAMENGYYDIAGYLIDTYLSGKSLSDSEYNKIDSYYPKLESYYATYDAVNQIFNGASGSNMEDAAYYDEVSSKLKALLKDSGQDAAYVYYCLGASEADTQAARNYMQQCYNLDPECFDVRGQLSIMYRRLGDFEKAKEFAGEALRKDKEDSTALRAMSTIAMLEGSLDDGLAYARDAYNSYPDGIYVRETYLIALTLSGENDEARKIQDEMAASGETLEEDTERLLNGDISLEDYYVGE